MKTIFGFTISLALAALFAVPAMADAKAEAAKAHAACVKAANGRLAATVKDLVSRKNKAGTAQVVKAIDDFLAQDPDATNAEVRAYANRAYFDMCSRNGTMFGRRFGAFDAKVANETVVRVAKGILADPKEQKTTKIWAAEQYCKVLAGDERYAEAEKVAKDVLAIPCPETAEAKVRWFDEQVNVKAWLLLVKVYRWWDKPDEALAAGREMCRRNRQYVGEIAQVLFDLDRYPAAFDLWKEFSTEAREMWYYCDHFKGRSIFDDPRYHDAIERRAHRFVRSGDAPASERFMIAVRFGFVGSDTPEGEADRAAFRDCDFTAKDFQSLNRNYVVSGVNRAYIDGNYPFFTRLVEAYSSFGGPFAAPKMRLAYAMALAYQGRDREALAAIAKERANEKLTPAEVAKFDIAKAVIEKRDALPILVKLDLPAKEKLAVSVFPAQFALNLRRNDECRRYAEAYRKLFKEIPHRRVDVPWFDTPVKSVEGWIKVREQLKSTFVDVKMYGDLENLVTDVATGRGEVKLGEAEGKLKIEVTQLCDVEGLHIFMAVKDRNARLVEKGFAGGFGNEMYFAPGANQPYICFGVGPKAGVEYTFQTAYTSFDHTRLESPKGEQDADALRSETAFFDDEYVYHLTFPWRAFYQKLPVLPGTAWKFDCLCWGNGCSWGGSQGVHEASSWGDLVFNLTPAQTAAIRRKIVFDTFKGWKGKGGYAPDLFDTWADNVIGDPEFYRTCLRPLEDELKGYVDRVKPDMSDADVNEVYAKGAMRWLGLRHEIDLLRHNYLTLKNTK